MSNRSDFDFDDEDDFQFENDDDFTFDDDDDIDFEGGLGDDFNDDDLTFEDEEAENRGPSRTFVIIAAVMIGLFILALVALFFLSGGGNTGPTPIQLTSTAIAQINETTIAQGLETQTQQAFDRVTETQQALDLTLTAQAPTATPTNTLTPTATLTPPLDATDQAATAIAQQLALTQTALAQPTETPFVPPTNTPAEGVSDISAVAQTATALAGILLPTVDDTGQGGGALVTPTQEGGFGPLPTALPDTGFLDDLAAGNPGSMGALLLAIVGLLGVIIVSRRLRTTNK